MMDPKSDPLPLTQRVKLVLTATIYACFFSFGLGSTMLGPARLDVAELIGASFQQVTYGSMGRSAGYATGALLSGWVFTKINRQLGIVGSLFGAAASIAVVPVIRNLSLYVTLELITGIMCSGIDVGGTAWVLEIWQLSANPYMQGLHFMFAFGMSLSPLIVEPFLSYDTNSTGAWNEEVHEFANSTKIHHESRIGIPYGIASFLLLATGALMLILYYKVPYTDPKRSVLNSKNGTSVPEQSSSVNASLSSTSDEDQLIQLQVQQQREKRYYMSLIVLGSLLFCFYNGVELSTFGFLPQFAVMIDLKLSKSKAAFLSSVMGAAFAANRIISIFVATKIRTKTMLYISFVMITIGNLLLLSFSNTSEGMLWTAVLIIGSGHSCVQACVMSFLEERMNVTTSVCSIFILSSTLSSIFIPIVLGNFIETYPLVYVYVNIVGLAAILTSFSGLYIVDRRFRKARKMAQVI